MYNERGMSAVVTTLIIILLAIVAVGIVWVVVKNIVDKGSDEITLTGLTLDLEITKASVEDDTLSVTVKRNSGEGDLIGINFVISDGDNSVVVTRETTLGELGVQTFTFSLSTLAVGEITSISIAPIFETSSGKETTGEIKDTTTSDSGDLGTGDPDYTGTPGGGDDSGEDPDCTPNCTGLECGLDPVCGESCGDCEGTDECINNMCVPDDCVAEDPAVTCAGFNCDNVTNNCEVPVNCSELAVPPGTCPEQHGGDPNWECIENVCTEITYINSGTVMWSGPPNVNKLFSGDNLLNESSYAWNFAALPGLVNPYCYPISDTKPGDDMYAYVILTIITDDAPLDYLNIIGEDYQIWENFGECCASLIDPDPDCTI